MISISATLQLNWPDYLIQFYSVLDLISSAEHILLSLDCLFDPRAYSSNTFSQPNDKSQLILINKDSNNLISNLNYGQHSLSLQLIQV